MSVVDFESGIIGIHSVAENKKNFHDRAAAKFYKGVKGVVVSRSEAGRARAIEHVCLEGDPLSNFLKNSWLQKAFILDTGNKGY